jgi:hypothetical protein
MKINKQILKMYFIKLELITTELYDEDMINVIEIQKLKYNRNISNILYEALFPSSEGGKNKKSLYKLTRKKITFLYKNKKIVRNIYLKKKKEYCKINKKYILLSKMIRI